MSDYQTKIASNSFILSEFNVGDGSNRCPTYTQILSYGLVVEGNYLQNQLVKIGDIHEPVISYTELSIYNNSDYNVLIHTYYDNGNPKSSELYSYDTIEFEPFYGPDIKIDCDESIKVTVYYDEDHEETGNSIFIPFSEFPNIYQIDISNGSESSPIMVTINLYPEESIIKASSTHTLPEEFEAQLSINYFDNDGNLQWITPKISSNGYESEWDINIPALGVSSIKEAQIYPTSMVIDGQQYDFNLWY